MTNLRQTAAETAGRGRGSGSCEKLRCDATPATIRAKARITCLVFFSFFFFLLFFLWLLRPHNATQNVALSFSNFADHKSEPNTLAATLCNTESSSVSRRHCYRHRHRHCQRLAPKMVTGKCIQQVAEASLWAMHSVYSHGQNNRHNMHMFILTSIY